jgi:hypothetical protein
MSHLWRIVGRLKTLRWEDWLAILLATAAGGLFASQCVSLGNASVDDAFISFSYSKNLALGNGPVYSHGVRVEGYSNFLWMVLVALPLAITRGAAPLAAARIMAAPFVLLLGWAVYRFARMCGVSRPTAALCILLLSFNTDLAVAYLAGLETLPYTALLAFAFVATAQSSLDNRWDKYAAWGGLAVALMRIDGFVPFGFLLVWMFLRAIGRRHLRAFGRYLFTALPPVIVYLLWFAWRWHYYGLPLPTTYYAKSLIPEVMPIHGLEYVAREIGHGWLWPGVVGWLWLLWRRRRVAALAGCLVALHLAYVVRVGGDWMPFGRFVLPVVPLLVSLLVVAAADLTQAAFRSRAPLRWFVPPIAATLILAMAGRMDHRFLNNDAEETKVGLSAGMTTSVSGYLRVAEFLRKVVPPGGRLVTDYGGVFAYFTDGAVIEMWGLANATIAMRGGTQGIQPMYGKTCPECYPELQPEYFHVMEPLLRHEPAFASADEVIANVWQTDTIGRHVDFKADFAVGRVFQPATNESLYFLQRRDTGLPARGIVTSDGFVIDYPFETVPGAPATDPGSAPHAAH